MDAGDLLKIFSLYITERAEEGEDDNRDDDDNNNKDNETEGGVEAEEEKTTKTGKTKQDTAKTFDTITEDCDDVWAFLQAVTVKSPQFTAAPLSH